MKFPSHWGPIYEAGHSHLSGYQTMIEGQKSKQSNNVPWLKIFSTVFQFKILSFVHLNIYGV